MVAEPHKVWLHKFNPQITLTVEIRLSRRFRLRKWLALRLIWLATLILGCGLEVEESDRTIHTIPCEMEGGSIWYGAQSWVRNKWGPDAHP
jgi:hypothetical protein